MSIVGIYGVHKRFRENKLKILVTGSAGFICGYTRTKGESPTVNILYLCVAR